MSEQSNNIDSLFKQKLAGHEVEMTDQDWSLMEARLKKPGNISGYWFVVLIAFVLVGAVAFLIFQSRHHAENDNFPIGLNGQDSLRKNQVRNDIDAGFDANHQDENSPILNASSDESNQTPENKTNQTTSEKNVVRPLMQDTPSTKEINVADQMRSSNEKGIRKSKSNFFGENSQENFSLNQVKVQSDEFSSMARNDLSNKRHSSNLMNSLGMHSDFPGAPLQTELFAAFKQSTNLFIISSIPGEFEFNRSGLEQNLTPRIRKNIGLWAVQVAGVAGWSQGYFTGKKENPYLQRRNKEESKSGLLGFEISVARNIRRMRLSTGLMYSRDGEAVSYSTEKETAVIMSDSVIQQVTHTEMHIDSFINPGTIFVTYDTTTVVVLADSLVVQNTVVKATGQDPALAVHNGKTKISHLVLPLRFSYRIFKTQKNRKLLLNSGFELDYIIARKAYYLSPSQDVVMNASDFTTYRNFMVNAIVGIEYNHTFFNERCYLIADPFIRYNLMSWNKSFQHRYLGYGIRFGVGYKF